MHARLYWTGFVLTSARSAPGSARYHVCGLVAVLARDLGALLGGLDRHLLLLLL
jgi:hypothetical protein